MEGRGFINAGDLKAGDEVRTADGSTVAVESLEKITHDEPIKVYNFEVEDFHTYYVSEQKVLVHNMCVATKKNAAKANNSNVVARKEFSNFSNLKINLGNAGEGNAWHHIVEQSQIKKSGFPPEKIHNIDNIIAIPPGKESIHAKISGFYSSKQAFTGEKTVRQWLSGQSFDAQFEFGINRLKQHGDVISTQKGYVFKPFD